MKRIDGYLAIDSNTKIVKEQKEVTGKSIYYLEIDGEILVFKPSIYEYNELFTSMCAKELGLDALEYDLALYKGFRGVISKNYKKDGAIYIEGIDILEKFYAENKELLDNLGISNPNNTEYQDEINMSRINNLEIIWLALEYYYKDYNLDIKTLMDKLVDLFIFCLLSNDSDKHSANWQLEEYNNNVSLVPIYDNERAFFFADEPLLLHVSTNDFKGNPYDKMLNEFLNISSREYIDRFLELYNILYSENKFDEIIEKIENKIGTKIPKYILNRLENSYYVIKSSIEQILEEKNICCHKLFN